MSIRVVRSENYAKLKEQALKLHIRMNEFEWEALDKQGTITIHLATDKTRLEAEANLSRYSNVILTKLISHTVYEPDGSVYAVKE